MISDEFLTRCPFCSQPDDEDSVPYTLKHMLLECSSWDKLRRELLLPILEDVGDEIDDDGRVVFLLGGEAGPSGKRVAMWAGKYGAISQVDYDLLKLLSCELWMETDDHVSDF
jgi:hypothetical protein